MEDNGSKRRAESGEKVCADVCKARCSAQALHGGLNLFAGTEKFNI